MMSLTSSMSVTRYKDVGCIPATMVDFGQWDHEDYYDASYENCNEWGEKRWSTPGVVVDGKLVTTRLTDINVGLEEFVEHSFYENWDDYPYKTDPLGNRCRQTIPGTRQRFHGLAHRIGKSATAGQQPRHGIARPLRLAPMRGCIFRR